MAMMQVPDLPLTLMMLMFAGLLLLVMHAGVFCRRFVKTDPATVGSGQSADRLHVQPVAPPL